MIDELLTLPMKTGAAVMLALTAILAVGSRSTLAYLFFVAAAVVTLYYWTVPD